MGVIRRESTVGEAQCDSNQQPWNIARACVMVELKFKGAIQELRLANGSLARSFQDRNEILLVNGTLKQSFRAGCLVVRFTNGDIKQSWPDGETLPSHEEKSTLYSDMHLSPLEQL